MTPLDLTALRARIVSGVGFATADALRLVDQLTETVAGLVRLHADLVVSDTPECWEHASAVDSLLYPFGVGPTRNALKEMDHGR